MRVIPVPTDGQGRRLTLAPCRTAARPTMHTTETCQVPVPARHFVFGTRTTLLTCTDVPEGADGAFTYPRRPSGKPALRISAGSDGLTTFVLAIVAYLRPARRGHPSPCGIRHSRMVRPINRSPTDRPAGQMTLVAQQWNNPWHGRATGAAIQGTLEDGCLGPPSGVRRAGRRHRGPHRDVVGIHAVGPGRRGDHLARCRRRDAGGVLLVPARAS